MALGRPDLPCQPLLRSLAKCFRLLFTLLTSLKRGAKMCIQERIWVSVAKHAGQTAKIAEQMCRRHP